MDTRILSQPWPVIGHEWAVDLLRRAVAAARPPHALLITGPPSVGKGTLARALAQALLCPDALPPCGTCRTCQLVLAGHHPDVRWVEPEGNYVKINQVRELTRQLVLSPVEGPWQIAVLNRFELATPEAADALLKTLEEPAPNVVLTLLAQQAEALPQTITSRCQVIALRTVPRATIAQALVERWEVTAEQARFLSQACSGRPGWAISAITSPHLLDQRTRQLDDLVKLLYSGRADRFAYAESLARQPMGELLEQLEIWNSWWRDLLLLTSQSSVPLTNVDRQAEMVALGAQLQVTAVYDALANLQTVREQLLQNANVRLALEVLFLDLPFCVN